MDQSLINPNQMRDQGIDVWENSYDREGDFGIVAEDIFIPFDSEGQLFHTCIPTQADLEELPHIVLTSIDGLTMSEQTLTERAINNVRVDAKEVKTKTRHSQHSVERISGIIVLD